MLPGLDLASFVERYTRWVLAHRAAVVGLCLAATLGAGLVLTRATFATSLVQSFLGDSPAYARYRQLTERFGDGELIVIAYEDQGLFADAGWARLVEVSAALRRLPFVRRVTALPDAFNVHGAAGELEVRTYAELRSKDPEAARAAALNDGLVGGALVARDGGSTCVLVEVLPYDAVPVEDLPSWVEALRAPFVAAGLAPDAVHLVGLVPETVEALAQTRLSVRRLLPITALVLLLVVYILFRQLWPVVITYGLAILSMAWASAFAVLVQPRINVMMAMVPTVILVIAFSDVIHMFAAYHRLLLDGVDRTAAIARTAAEVGRACFYNSLTMGVGFLAMALAPAPVFRQLALALSVGVALALWLAMTLVPICFSWLPTPKSGALAEARVPRLLSAVIRGTTGFAIRRPKLVLAATAALIAVSVAGLSRLEIEMSMMNRLSPENPLRQAQRFIQARFDGTNFLEVYVSTETGSLLEPERFRALQNLQTEIAGLPGVDRVQSVVNLLDQLHHELGGASGERSGAALAQELLLYEMAGGQRLDELLDPDHRTLRMTVRLADTEVTRAASTGARIEALGGQRLAGVELLPTGLTYIIGSWLRELIRGQELGLWLSLLGTTVIIVFCLGSFGAGVVSMLPNVLPMLVIGGAAGWFWGQVDASILLVDIVAIGIAVDDTMHFLTRYEIDRARHSDHRTALMQTAEHVGPGMLQTALILCLGLLPFAASDHATTRMMGALLPLTLALAVVCELFITPALMSLGLLRSGRRG